MRHDGSSITPIRRAIGFAQIRVIRVLGIWGSLGALVPWTVATVAVAQGVASPDTVLPRRIQLGATLAAVPDTMRQRGAPLGALVIGVAAASPASIAGLRTGDIIVAVAADSVRTVADALSALRPVRSDITVPLAIFRDRRLTTIVVRTRERPREASTEFTIEYHAVSARGGKHRVLVAHPADGQPHPAVLLIGGIGCYSVDSPVGPNSYRDLAYHLTRRGYTTVRVEKLGVGDSEGGPCIDTDFQTELDGYRQTLRAMARYRSVDANKIFLFGHSIGGIEAPLLAAEGIDGLALRGIAVLSTTGIAWYEYELANLRRQLRLQRLAPDSIESEMRLKTTCGYAFLLEKESRQSIIARNQRCAPYLAYPASDEYMQAVAEYTPAVIWRRVSAPALVMYGTSDFITSRAEHIALTEDINVMHPGAATFAEIPELDHYLSREASQQASIEDPVNGLVRPYYGATLEPVIDQWLDAQTRRVSLTPIHGRRLLRAGSCCAMVLPSANRTLTQGGRHAWGAEVQLAEHRAAGMVSRSDSQESESL